MDNTQGINPHTHTHTHIHIHGRTELSVLADMLVQTPTHTHAHIDRYLIVYTQTRAYMH